MINTPTYLEQTR